MVIALASRKTQWQNPECIYGEILNKTCLALMVTSEMLYIFSSLRVRQQDMFAVRGDATQFRHREVRWEGPIMFSK
jgi:hypothetical protein